MILNNSGSSNADVLNQIKESLEDLMMQLEASRQMYTIKPPEKGFDYHWFFDAKTKALERFNTSIQVEIIEDYDDDSYLCAYKDKMIIIPYQIFPSEKKSTPVNKFVIGFNTKPPKIKTHQI